MALQRLSKSLGILISAEEPVEVSPVMKDARQVALLKSSEERFVFGVVLEPTKELGKPDSQGDIYSAEEVRQSCHKFMEQHRNIGLQHEKYANDRVSILENYIAPADFEIDGQRVAKGTWLLGLRVDQGLWDAIKQGEITGFSIGGFARRTRVR